MTTPRDTDTSRAACAKSLIAAAALALAAGPALAHATLEQSELPAGQTAKVTLRVPHGCDGQATHTIRFSIPDGFYAAKPMPKPGWTLTTEDGPYATPFDNHGTEMTGGVREVIWSGGNLEDGWYDEFTVRGTIGGEIEPGTVLHFPAVQICATDMADWTDISGEEGVDNPAPSLTVAAAAPADHGHGHGADAAATSSEAATHAVGDLTITSAFARATLPNAPVAGGFMTISNDGGAADRLIAARSTVAGRMEMHEMAMDGEVMRMRELNEGLPIPAGETVALRPGGYHLMFVGLREPLVEGESVEVTLVFETAGEVTIPLSIGAPNAGGGNAESGMDHGTHTHN